MKSLGPYEPSRHPPALSSDKNLLPSPFSHRSQTPSDQTGHANKRGCHFSLEALSQGWSLEILSCLVSAAALVSLIIVLKKYDQQPIPSWPLGITLNTLLAFLTAVSHAGFVKPVFQGLSQMKWNWFSDKDRPLADFGRFDSASRGTWGSVLLLFSMKGRFSVLMATVILLSSTVTSTITQAALTQGTRYTPDGAGTASINAMFNDFANVTDSETNQVANKILSAALAPISQTYGTTDTTCTSGNCDFPVFSSLAVCVDTNDITSNLILQEANVTSNLTSFVTFAGSKATLAKNNNSVWLTSEFGEYLNSTSIIPDENWDELYTFSNVSYEWIGVSGAQIIYLNATGHTVSDTAGEVLYDNATSLFMPYVRAVEAMFYMCVQTYNVTTVNGTTQTVITSTDTNITPINYTLPGKAKYAATNVGVTVDGQNYTFATSDIPSILSMYFSSIITGAYPSADTSSGWTPFPSSLGLALYPSGDTLSDQAMFQNVELLLGNMAREATNWMRATYGTPIQGQNYVLNTYIIVRWPYITLLAAQVALSSIFLAWIILDTRRCKVGVLKQAALPTLFALSAEDRLTLQNRVSVRKIKTPTMSTSSSTSKMDDGWKNAMEDVGTRSSVYLGSGDFGQWHLRLAR